MIMTLYFSIVGEMLRRFDPSLRGRGFFKRTGKEILSMKLAKKSKGIKRSSIRMKKLDEFKKKTEDGLLSKNEKFKKINSELDALK